MGSLKSTDKLIAAGSPGVPVSRLRKLASALACDRSSGGRGVDESVEALGALGELLQEGCRRCLRFRENVVYDAATGNAAKLVMI